MRPRWKSNKTTTGNKRVMNAVKHEEFGQKFDSSLELYMYHLIMNKPYKTERQHEFVLMEGFRNATGKKIMDIKWRCDFYIPELNVVIDTKGWATEIFTIKFKLFERCVYDGKIPSPALILFPKSQNHCLLAMAECDALYKKLKTT
jgi:hypothetical protein